MKTTKLESMIYNEISSMYHISKKSVAPIAIYIRENDIDYEFPSDLVAYMKNKYPGYTLEHILEVYIRYQKFRKRDISDLDRARELNLREVKIKTSEDSRICFNCEKHANKIYKIEEVPELPLYWGCRCYYEPQVT